MTEFELAHSYFPFFYVITHDEKPINRIFKIKIGISLGPLILLLFLFLILRN